MVLRVCWQQRARQVRGSCPGTHLWVCLAAGFLAGFMAGLVGSLASFPACFPVSLASPVP